MKGHTIPCSVCKKILIRFVNIKEGDLEMLCPHCDTLVKVEAKPKVAISVCKVLLILLLILGFATLAQSERVQTALIEEN